jgi:hypothetical protein
MKYFSKTDYKLIIIIILTFVVAWFIYTDYFNKALVSENSSKTIASLNEARQMEKVRLKRIESGDKSSMCAAIYALTEESWAGQGLEFLIFINPIDEDEKKIGKMVRLFYSVALEHYKSSGESDISAKYLADYTVMENITFLRGLEIGGTFSRGYPDTCKTILEEVREIAKAQIDVGND